MTTVEETYDEMIARLLAAANRKEGESWEDYYDRQAEQPPPPPNYAELVTTMDRYEFVRHVYGNLRISPYGVYGDDFSADRWYRYWDQHNLRPSWTPDPFYTLDDIHALWGMKVGLNLNPEMVGQVLTFAYAEVIRAFVDHARHKMSYFVVEEDVEVKVFGPEEDDPLQQTRILARWMPTSLAANIRDGSGRVYTAWGDEVMQKWLFHGFEVPKLINPLDRAWFEAPPMEIPGPLHCRLQGYDSATKMWWFSGN